MGHRGDEPHYAAAWAWAGNTPFQWGKQVASHLGGTRNPMVVSWPARIRDRGGLRTQFTHCIDVGPTILEAVGLPVPSRVNGVAQMPMHGISFTRTFVNAMAPEAHTQQYFEIYGNRAIYKDGWWACARLPRIPWDLSPAAIRRLAPDVYDPSQDPWELYYLPDDFSQANDLATENPGKLRELQELFWAEADRYQVTPLLAGLSFYFGIVPPIEEQTQRTYYGSDVQNVAPGTIPRIYNRSYAISADLDIPSDGAEGVIVAEVDHLGGFALYVDRDGKLKHAYSTTAVWGYKQESEEPLPTGRVNVRMQFQADAPEPATGGQVTLYVNGRPVGGGRMEHTVPFHFTGYAGLDIGRDNGLPVDRSYADRSPYAFTGKIEKVVFDLQPAEQPEAEQQLHELAQQGAMARGMSA